MFNQSKMSSRGIHSEGLLCYLLLRPELSFARAVAHVHEELGSVVERYRELAGLIDTVDTRLMIALCGREDMQEIIQEVR
ncbi:hypothetical protein DIE07_11880 [Burkholderia sp. Bp9002]|nr:hypothetical protein DIE07_11880 [Burkholderia sp. Bp9002]